jgi:hypothetical protein
MVAIADNVISLQKRFKLCSYTSLSKERNGGDCGSLKKQISSSNSVTQREGCSAKCALCHFKALRIRQNIKVYSDRVICPTINAVYGRANAFEWLGYSAPFPNFAELSTELYDLRRSIVDAKARRDSIAKFRPS